MSDEVEAAKAAAAAYKSSDVDGEFPFFFSFSGINVEYSSLWSTLRGILLLLYIVQKMKMSALFYCLM